MEKPSWTVLFTLLQEARQSAAAPDIRVSVYELYFVYSESCVSEGN